MPGTKEDIKNILNEIIDLFDKIHPVGNKAQREIIFQPLANKIQHLELLVGEMMPYMLENARRIKTHYGAAFRIEVTNGHSFEQHLQWANNAIYRIRAELEKI